MPDVVFTVDQTKSMRDQAVPGHNRWHPDIPVAAMVRPGDEFRVECREWTDAQIGNNDSANDVRDVDLSHAHMLSGPHWRAGSRARRPARCRHPRPRPSAFHKRSATPPARAGATPASSPGERREVPDRLVPRRLQGDLGLPRPGGDLRHLPGVSYTGITHPGLFGTAPSAELLARWNRREQALIDPIPTGCLRLALPPLSHNSSADGRRRRGRPGRAGRRADSSGA